MGVPDETVEASDSASGARTTRELAVGNTLGKYRLDRVLGSGGMGIVWAAHDPDLERAVALKVLRHEHASHELRTRLLREARAMARLKHPNVLTVYEVDSEGDRDFIAMELVDGASLDAWAATKPSREALWDAIVAAGQGLAAAHRAGLVHRDFKPHNVLRSEDGRVLVTDFGLARSHDELAVSTEAAVASKTPTGALDETIEAAPTPASTAIATARSSPSGSRNTLDVPLTQTGAVIGTPAYMAPEQFRGAAPDPRTDQFAYCVTAWQLLTGARPFQGATIEELRRAAEGGVAAIKTSLPRAVRAVLARGLEPDPHKRWPDMMALLGALSRTRHRRHARVAFAGVVGVAAVALTIKLASSPGEQRAAPAAPTPPPSMCETSPETEIAKAWSPALRAEGMRTFGRGFERLAAELDAFAQRWVASYRSACSGPGTTRTYAKLGCLLGERDEVTNLADLIRRVPVARIDEVEMAGLLPRTQACEGDTPVAPPPLPEDPDKQARIRALRHKLTEARFLDAKAMFARMPQLLAEAEGIGWQPLLAEAHHTFAIAAERDGKQWELLRDHYKKANQLARSTHHAHLEAATWTGLLASEIDAASDPSDDKSFLELVQQARLATRSAGDDPVFHARITKIEGQHASCRGRLDEAIAKYDEARKMELEARDLPTAMRFAAETADLMLRRNRPGDLDAAWRLLADTEQSAVAAKVSPSKFETLLTAGAMIATLRGDHATARAWLDRTRPPDAPPTAVTMTGRVVGADGQPAAGATVVAWTGLLRGHAHRLFLSREFKGAVATTDASGVFTVRGYRTGGIVAELGDRRSQPRIVGDGEIELKLEPTRTVKGVVTSDGSLTGVFPAATYLLGAKQWALLQIAAPIKADRTFELGGLPQGEARMWIDDLLDQNKPMRKIDGGPLRDDITLRWPVGPTIDAIVHGVTDNSTMAFVLRGKQSPKTIEELGELTLREPVVLGHPALIVGIGDQTVEGMKHYLRGDRHAVFLHNAPGEVSVCVSRVEPKSPARCQTITLPSGPVEKREGRDVYPTVALEFRL
jgi:serine/threonine protein kinase